MGSKAIAALAFLFVVAWAGRAAGSLEIDFSPRSLPAEGGRWTILVVASDSLQPTAIGVQLGDETIWDRASWQTTSGASLWDLDLPPLLMGSGPCAVVARLGTELAHLDAVPVRLPPNPPDSLILADRVEVFLQPDVLLYEPGIRRRAIADVGFLSGPFSLLLSRLDVVGVEKVTWNATESDSLQYIGPSQTTVWLSPRARRSYRLLFGSPGHSSEAMARILAEAAEVIEARPVRTDVQMIRP